MEISQLSAVWKTKATGDDYIKTLHKRVLRAFVTLYPHFTIFHFDIYACSSGYSVC